MVTAM